jgi:hypothetical protein
MHWCCRERSTHQGRRRLVVEKSGSGVLGVGSFGCLRFVGEIYKGSRDSSISIKKSGRYSMALSISLATNVLVDKNVQSPLFSLIIIFFFICFEGAISIRDIKGKAATTTSLI